MDNQKDLKGIGLFQLSVIHLISLRKEESVADIEKHLSQGDLIEYIYNKYSDSFFINFDGSCYDNKALNSYFCDYDGCIQGNEARKYGVMNETDGLLLILALISDLIERNL